MERVAERLECLLVDPTHRGRLDLRITVKAEAPRLTRRVEMHGGPELARTVRRGPVDPVAARAAEELLRRLPHEGRHATLHPLAREMGEGHVALETAAEEARIPEPNVRRDLAELLPEMVAGDEHVRGRVPPGA